MSDALNDISRDEQRALDFFEPGAGGYENTRIGGMA
jgi:hypothetical protein